MLMLSLCWNMHEVLLSRNTYGIALKDKGRQELFLICAACFICCGLCCATTWGIIWKKDFSNPFLNTSVCICTPFALEVSKFISLTPTFLSSSPLSFFNWLLSFFCAKKQPQHLECLWGESVIKCVTSFLFWGEIRDHLTQNLRELSLMISPYQLSDSSPCNDNENSYQ